MYRTDVFVIGGGPAGLAAAIAACRKGLHVTVADGARPPIDKPCGEGLMPDGLAALRELGVVLESGDGYPFQGIRFLGAATAAAADFTGNHGLGVRRTVLHSRMVAAAGQAGVQMLWGAPVSGISLDGVRLGNHTVQARWIVGADGFQSRVRQWAGLAVPRPRHPRFGFRAHYRMAPWSRYMELHWGDACQIYVTPVAADEVCVAAISRDPRARLDTILARFPSLNMRLPSGAQASVERGAPTANYTLPRVHRGLVALIGDASGSVDAVAGEGLCLSFRQAIALAGSLASDSLEGYELAHQRIARRPMRMSALMLTMDRRTWLRERAIRALAAEPRIFGRLLSTHVGSLSPLGVAANGCALAWQMATLPR